MPSFQVSTTTATLVASTAYTAIELRTPSTGGAWIKKAWADFNSATSTDKPVLVQMGKFSAAITTATANIPMPLNYLGNISAANTAASVNATVEGAGTFTANGELHNVLPQGGMYVGWDTDETALWVPPSSFFRIRITPGSAITSTTACCGVAWLE